MNGSVPFDVQVECFWLSDTLPITPSSSTPASALTSRATSRSTSINTPRAAGDGNATSSGVSPPSMEGALTRLGLGDVSLGDATTRGQQTGDVF